MVLRCFSVLLLFIMLSTSAHAMIVEPYFGKRIIKDPNEFSRSFDNLYSYYGVQVGTLIKKFVVSAELGMAESFKHYGAVVSTMLDPRSKIMIRYSPYFKSGDSSYYTTGTVFGVSLGFRIVRKLFLQVEYFSINNKEYVYDGGSQATGGSISLYGLSLSLPIRL